MPEEVGERPEERPDVVNRDAEFPPEAALEPGVEAPKAEAPEAVLEAEEAKEDRPPEALELTMSDRAKATWYLLSSASRRFTRKLYERVAGKIKSPEIVQNFTERLEILTNDALAERAGKKIDKLTDEQREQEQIRVGAEAEITSLEAQRKQVEETFESLGVAQVKPETHAKLDERITTNRARIERAVAESERIETEKKEVEELEVAREARAQEFRERWAARINEKIERQNQAIGEVENRAAEVLGKIADVEQRIETLSGQEESLTQLLETITDKDLKKEVNGRLREIKQKLVPVEDERSGLKEKKEKLEASISKLNREKADLEKERDRILQVEDESEKEEEPEKREEVVETSKPKIEEVSLNGQPHYGRLLKKGSEGVAFEYPGSPVDIRLSAGQAGRRLQIIDVQGDKRFDADYLLIDPETFNPEDDVPKGFKGIHEGESFTVGRDSRYMSEIFDLPDTVSREHLKVQFRNGKFTLVDLNSTNGTVVEYRQPKEETGEGVAVAEEERAASEPRGVREEERQSLITKGEAIAAWNSEANKHNKLSLPEGASSDDLVVGTEGFEQLIDTAFKRKKGKEKLTGAKRKQEIDRVWKIFRK